MIKYLFFLFTYICTLNIAYAQIDYKVTENEVIVFSNNADLVINKKQWHISLQNKEGKIIFEEAESPSFRVDTSWFPYF